jgi:hypothetical protein
MTIRYVDLFTTLATLAILNGVFSFFYIGHLKKSFNKNHENGDTFYDYCCRRCKDEPIWWLRKKLNMRWYYNSKAFIRISRFNSVLQVLLGIIIFIAIFLVSRTEYWELFKLPF